MDSRLSGPDTSLNAPLVDDGGSTAERSDFLVSDDPLPDEIVAETIDVERRAGWLKDALGVLNEREMKIIERAPAAARRARRWRRSARRSASPRSACARSNAARWKS